MDKIYIYLKKIINVFLIDKFYYIHIGKTGGSWFRKNIWNTIIPLKYKIIIGAHGDNFCGDLKDYKVFIIPIRDPFKRLESGFNSRLRRGMPAYNNPWSKEEEVFFSEYPSFEIFIKRAIVDLSSYKKFKSINIHEKFGYEYYFSGKHCIENLKKNKVYIIEQENLEMDFSYMLSDLISGSRLKERHLKKKVHVSFTSPSLDIQITPHDIAKFKQMFLGEEYKYYNAVKEISYTKRDFGIL